MQLYYVTGPMVDIGLGQHCKTFLLENESLSVDNPRKPRRLTNCLVESFAKASLLD